MTNSADWPYGADAPPQNTITDEQIREVRVGAAHTCVDCDGEIHAGSRAMRRSRRAETHRDRMHADGRGLVHWYRHVHCAVSK
jgi:hypothetical protein